MSIGRAFAVLAARDPDRVAVRDGEQVLTRRELHERTDRLARAWRRRGLRPDDLVTVTLGTGVAAVLANVAVWKAGATPQPLSPHLAPAEREAVLALARPALVVNDDAQVLDALAAEAVDGTGTDPLPDLAASSWKAPTSSGSTGRPRLVRAAASAHVDPDAAVAAFVPRDAVQLVAAPLWHAASYVYAFRGLMTGHELVLLPRPDPQEWLRAVAAHRVTWAVLAPDLMQQVWRSPDRAGADVGSLEAVLHLGSRCPPWLKRAWLGWLGPERVWELYAGTESQGLALVGGREWLQRPGTVGRGVGGSRFRVVRPDGTECDPGETGEVLMRRGHDTYHYVGSPARVRDGWHTLGDAGRLDADGYLYLADRLADGIETPGGTVHPADVEQVLQEHPGVRCAVVVGRTGDGGTQHVHAVVEPEPWAGPGSAELVAWAAARLHPHQQPRSVELVDRPLRDDTGKVRRARWR
ncbi:AMP-binding protein [Jannaschia sp. R86511]|uniref:AMP-binding protein n=1 Tax=Jannaschia sp. R86511 TaxID=3093853 RepID=UPI0036D3D71E